METELYLPLRDAITASPIVADCNQDGRAELVVTGSSVYVLSLLPPRNPSQNIQLLKRFTPSAPCASTPCVFLCEDGKPLILVGSDDDHLYCFSWEKEDPLWRFPTKGDIYSSPLLCDLDGDGFKELLFGSDDGTIYSLKLSPRGEILSSRGIETGFFVSASPVLLPAGEGYDLVIGSWDGCLYCIQGSTFTLRWKVPLGGILWSTPVVADLDGDGRWEIVVVHHDLHILKDNGTPLLSPPVPLGSFTVASPLVTDLNGDSLPELILAADALYRMDREGVIRWAGTSGGYWASPILLDFDGDGAEEIVACDYEGLLWVMRGEGECLPGFPRPFAASFLASPLAADLDGDGKLELVLCDGGGNLHILPCQGELSSWNQFRGREGNGICSRSFAPGFLLRGTSAGLGKEGDPSPARIQEVPRRRRRLGGTTLVETRLRIAPPFSLKQGIMYFQKHGQFLPSPLFGNGETFVGRFPPLPRFRWIHYYFELEFRNGSKRRIPQQGTKRFFVVS